jgi:hypothetical protein
VGLDWVTASPTSSTEPGLRICINMLAVTLTCQHPSSLSSTPTRPELWAGPGVDRSAELCLNLKKRTPMRLSGTSRAGWLLAFFFDWQAEPRLNSNERENGAALPGPAPRLRPRLSPKGCQRFPIKSSGRQAGAPHTKHIMRGGRG